MTTTPYPSTSGNQPSSEITRVLAQRVSVCDNADRPVEDHSVRAMLKAAFRTPTLAQLTLF